RLPRDRGEPAVDRYGDPVRRVEEPRGRLGPDDRPGDRAEHPRRHPVRVGARDRAGPRRVHDLVTPRLQHDAGRHLPARQARSVHLGRRVAGGARVRLRAPVRHHPVRAGRRPSKPGARGGARRMTATASPTASPVAAGRGVAVSFQEMHRWYGSVHALDGLTLDIAPGELIALLGPSGCGKTTALRALGGLDEVDLGTILVDGKDVTHVPANKRNMGVVFQAYSLFPNMTARDNVGYGLRLHGVGGA